MGGMSKRESSDKRVVDFHNRMKKRAKEGKQIPLSDEQGKYYSWKHDKSNSISFRGERLQEFKRLEEKYGKI